MHAYHPTKELYIISTRHGYADFKMIDGNLLYLKERAAETRGKPADERVRVITHELTSSRARGGGEVLW